MTLIIFFEKCLNLIIYYLLLYIGRWSELDILTWLTRRRGWAWIFPNELYIADATIAHEILVHRSASCFNKAPVDEKSPLSTSMLNDPQRRRDSRHILQQSLSLREITNNYVPIFQKCTEYLINQWRSSNDVVDVTEACTRLALDIVGETLLGGTFGACVHQGDGNELTRCMLMIMRDKFTANNLRRNETGVDVGNEIKFIDNLIRHRWTNSEQILDFDNTKLVLFAGSETTATTLALTLLTLAYRKDVQTMLRDQLAAQTISEIEQNTLLDSFIREILRFWSIAPFITRRCTRSVLVQAENGRTLFIPFGSDVNIFTWSIHRSSDYYARAEEFDMTRMPPNKHHFLPFSTGSRMCPGMAFAISELKVIVSLLLQFIEFEPTNKVSVFDSNRILAQQRFHIDWHHAVLHTQQHVYLQLRFLPS